MLMREFFSIILIGGLQGDNIRCEFICNIFNWLPVSFDIKS